MDVPAVLLKKLKVAFRRPAVIERKPGQLQKECADFTEEAVAQMRKRRGDEHAVVPQHAANLSQRLFRLDVQRVGDDHHVKGFVGIREVEHILHGEVQLARRIVAPCLRDHLRRLIRGLDGARYARDLARDQPRARRQLQHILVLHGVVHQVNHPLVGRCVPSEKGVVAPGVFIPEVLVHRRHGKNPLSAFEWLALPNPCAVKKPLPQLFSC